MNTLRLSQVHKYFDTVHVIRGINLDIESGEFIVFVGPSGCGKSTMLRLIAGLEDVSSGTVEIEGRDVTSLGAAQRGLAMVFQSYALYPHMTVRENMGFGLKVAGRDKEELKQAVESAADVLQLRALLERKPKELSGGQRQRVAIGRALVRQPAAFLFDEPLSNLDAALRVQMRIEIGRLHRTLGKTMIYVTHDQIEAMTLADRIVVFNAGVIQQQGKPLELYSKPSNLFVATFIGSPKMNLLSCTAENRGLRLADGTLIETNPGSQASYFGIRPEHISICSQQDAHISGVVGVAEHLGSDSFAYIDIEAIDEPITVRLAGEASIEEGQKVGLRFELSQCHLFDSNEQRIG